MNSRREEIKRRIAAKKRRAASIDVLACGFIHGVGPSYAERLLNAYGTDDAYDVVSNPALASRVGVPQNIARSLSAEAEFLRGNIHSIAYLRSLTFDMGERTFHMGAPMIRKVVNRLGDKAEDAVREDPYQALRGTYGFRTIDAFALNSLGLDRSDTRRVSAALVGGMADAIQDGDTYCSRDAVRKATCALLGSSEDGAYLDANIDKLVKRGAVVEDDCGLHPLNLWDAEHDIVGAVRTMAAWRSHGLDPESGEALAYAKRDAGAKGRPMTDEQALCVENALTRGLSIIVGRAGYGKSAACAAIYAAVEEGLRKRAVLLAPTGRAASHLAEECCGPAGASLGLTVHRALALSVRDKASVWDDLAVAAGAAETDATREFDRAALVICDEASMLDTEMASILISACAAQGKHLVLVGDHNQLPSVGPGAVLRDLTDAFPDATVTLTKPFRQREGGAILAAAERVLDGHSPVVDGIESHWCDERDVAATVREVVRSEHAQMSDTLVISPTKKRGLCSSTESLNDVLRPLLNPTFVRRANNDLQSLQEGDYVMQLDNNYQRGVFNGDCGTVRYIDDDGTYIIQFEGHDDYTRYDSVDARSELTLAYACTVHKAQGSQAGLVVVVMTRSCYRGLRNRNLLYTAVTRAKDKLVLVGEKAAFDEAASNMFGNTRNTGLSALLAKEVG